MTALQPAPAGTAATAPVRITVPVPTFPRPHDLQVGLPMLLEHAREVSADPSGRYVVDVLVVDNDPERGAEALVATFPSADLRYAAEPTPGIAICTGSARTSGRPERGMHPVGRHGTPGGAR